LFGACDAVVLPSAREGFAICLIEAMAARRPVVASDIEGPNEFVKHEVTGLLYPCGDVGLLIERLARVLETDTTAMVDRALEMARASYALAPMVDSHVRAYEEHL
jgi:glycosyltransferase involved in cell wall biosynthesis